jgi:alkyl hydroperoxide reductase subunit AhpC
VKLIGLSANGLEQHEAWIKDIEAFGAKVAGPTHVKYPIVSQGAELYSRGAHCIIFFQIADKDRKVATLYDMLDHQDATNVDAKGIPFTVRTVFIIDPKKVIRLTVSYPASTGRNFDEILRVVDCEHRLVLWLESVTHRLLP